MERTRGIRTGHLIAAAIAITGIIALVYGLTALWTVSASDYHPPVVVGQIETDEVKESSGLAASECQDVLWTHNDAGNDAVVYAMNTAGKHLGAWRIPNASNVDWESIAGYRDKAGKCFLLIGDIGDNDLARSELQVYRIPEPIITPETPAVATSTAHVSEPSEVMKVSYADGRHNAETLLVNPHTGFVYVVTKEKSGPAAVHRIKPDFGSNEPVKTEKIATISVPAKPEGLLTGGSISPDGRRVMLCDKQNGYELVLPPDAAKHDDLWAQKPVTVDLGDRKQGEGVSYGRDGISLYASSEKKNAPLFLIKRR